MAKTINLAWEREEDEPARWFHRLDAFYRPMGPDRSLLGAYKIFLAEKDRKGQPIPTTPPTAWRKNAKLWRWQARAEAWDAHQRAARIQHDEQERVKQRRARRAILQGLKAKLGAAVLEMDPKDLTPKEIVAAIHLVMEQDRIEYDDEPATKHTGDITIRFAGNVDMEKL